MVWKDEESGKKFLFLHNVQADSGAHPAFYTMGNRGSFQGDEADHSLPFGAKIKIVGDILPPHHIFHGVMLH
jgi:hypothetical protein